MPSSNGAMEDNEGGICGYEGLSSTWYGRRGNQFCGSHRAAWLKWRRDEGNYDDHEDPSYLSSIGEILGTRYCEPSKMAGRTQRRARKYNINNTHRLDGALAHAHGLFNFLLFNGARLVQGTPMT